MARYEITTETDRSIVHRTTGKLPTDIRVRHHARSMEHAVGDLLRLTIYSDGEWILFERILFEREPTAWRQLATGVLPTN